MIGLIETKIEKALGCYYEDKADTIESSFLCNGGIIEIQSSNEDDIFCDTYFFNKKKLIAHRLLRENDLSKETDLFLGCNMIVLIVDNQKKKIFIDKIKEIYDKNNCYGTVVHNGKSEFFIFPKLKYHDVFLIKSIFEKKYTGSNTDISYGNIAI